MLRLDRKKRTAPLRPADWITAGRGVLALLLLFPKPLSAEFYGIYTLAGLSDAADGAVARRTGTQSEAGARLDSGADLMLLCAAAFRLLPGLWRAVPAWMWAGGLLAALLRCGAYWVGWRRHRTFAPPHTLCNKLTGLALFAVPYGLAMLPPGKALAVPCGLAVLSAAEELWITWKRKKPDPELRGAWELYFPNGTEIEE